jgi:predicted adenine nucleotide alpha hydrolase (AANH) superfamily ATPase
MAEDHLKVLLHICCGICAAGALESLRLEGHEVIGFFYNPNIYPPEEYQRRLEVTQFVTEKLGVPLKIASYDPEEWHTRVIGLEQEPEGGPRCAACFRLRLEKTSQSMAGYGCDAFTTTLTISPHKSAAMVNRLGTGIGGERFLVRDFKKRNGFKRAIELAKRWALYRQDYCGCVYSQKSK